MRDLAEQSLNEMRRRNSDIPRRRGRTTHRSAEDAPAGKPSKHSHREMNVPHIDPAVVFIRLSISCAFTKKLRHRRMMSQSSAEWAGRRNRLVAFKGLILERDANGRQ